MLTDFIANADNVFGDGTSNLKDATFDADRIGFTFLELTLTGTAGYTGPTQLYDYPQGVDQIPFLLAKGHRIDEFSDEIAGIGWLSDVLPENQNGSSETRDFLFRVGAPIPEPSTAWLFGVGSLVVGGLLRKRL